MKKRLFIGLALPNEIKKHLKREMEKISPRLQDARVVKPDLWHITLLFLGYQEDEFLPAIIEALQKAGEAFSPPLIKFSHMATHPQKKPRVLWVETDQATAEILRPIKNLLEESVLASGLPLDPDIHPLRPHITLARIEERARIEVNPISLTDSFEAETLELFESILDANNGPEYITLQRFAFGEKTD